MHLSPSRQHQTLVGQLLQGNPKSAMQVCFVFLDPTSLIQAGWAIRRWHHTSVKLHRSATLSSSPNCPATSEYGGGERPYIEYTGCMHWPSLSTVYSRRIGLVVIRIDYVQLGKRQITESTIQTCINRSHRIVDFRYVCRTMPPPHPYIEARVGSAPAANPRPASASLEPYR